MKQYIISGIEFTQEEMCLNQITAFLNMLKDLEIDDAASLSVASLISILGSKMADFLHIILKSEKEVKPEFFGNAIKTTQIVEVLEDFFTFNDIPSLVPRVVQMLNRMGLSLIQAKKS